MRRSCLFYLSYQTGMQAGKFICWSILIKSDTYNSKTGNFLQKKIIYDTKKLWSLKSAIDRIEAKHAAESTNQFPVDLLRFSSKN